MQVPRRILSQILHYPASSKLPVFTNNWRDVLVLADDGERENARRVESVWQCRPDTLEVF
jgi:hypothetical protein